MNRGTALILTTIAVLGAAATLPAGNATGQQSPPAWAYPVNPPGIQPAADDGTLNQVPGSAAAFSRTQLRDLFNVPDWHPGDHPAMPEIVSHGRKPNTLACGFCHLPTGYGRPENSSLAGLPVAYIVQQLADFKSGARKTSVPARLPAKLMTSVAESVTDGEVAAAAAYFSGLKPKSHVRVVETNTVPSTYVTGWILAKSRTGGMEPIGQRIIEVPEDVERFELRDGRTEFTAYAPIGSIAKGEALVRTGGAGKTIQCGICHGSDLKGLGLLPGIASRSPSYIMRQLYDLQSGARAGAGSALMKPVVAKLSEEDMVSIAAYLASRVP